MGVCVIGKYENDKSTKKCSKVHSQHQNNQREMPKSIRRHYTNITIMTTTTASSGVATAMAMSFAAFTIKAGNNK